MAEPGLRPFSLDNPPLDGLRRNDARRRAETRPRTRRAGSAPGAWIHLIVIGIAGVTAVGAFFAIGFTLLTQTTAPLETGRPEPAPPPVGAQASAPVAAVPAPALAAAPTPAPAPAAEPAKPPAESDRTADDHSAPMAASPTAVQPTPDKTESAPSQPKPAAPAAADPAPATPAEKPAAPSPAATASPAPLPLPPISTAEAARFVHYGEGFLRHAELPAARLFFAAAAAAGDARGALHMGETFDPTARSRRRGESDPALARDWYQRAADLGSIEAVLRLERLDGSDRGPRR